MSPKEFWVRHFCQNDWVANPLAKVLQKRPLVKISGFSCGGVLYEGSVAPSA